MPTLKPRQGVNFFFFNPFSSFFLSLPLPHGPRIATLWQTPHWPHAGFWRFSHDDPSSFVISSVFRASQQAVLPAGQDHSCGDSGQQGSSDGSGAEGHRRLQEDGARGRSGPPVPPPWEWGHQREWSVGKAFKNQQSKAASQRFFLITFSESLFSDPTSFSFRVPKPPDPNGRQREGAVPGGPSHQEAQRGRPLRAPAGTKTLLRLNNDPPPPP